MESVTGQHVLDGGATSACILLKTIRTDVWRASDERNLFPAGWASYDVRGNNLEVLISSVLNEVSKRLSSTGAASTT